MPTLFRDFYATVEFDLRQRAEYLTGNESDDLAKPLPSKQAMRLTNEAIISLLRRVPVSRTAKPLLHTFTTSTQELNLSDAILVIGAVKVGSSWRFLDNAFTKNNSGINAIGDALLVNKGWWKPGDTIELMVTYTPDEITDEMDPITFPAGYMELLRKEVVIQAASIVNIDLSQLYTMRYAELVAAYVASQRVRANARINGFRKGDVINRGKR